MESQFRRHFPRLPIRGTEMEQEAHCLAPDLGGGAISALVKLGQDSLASRGALMGCIGDWCLPQCGAVRSALRRVKGLHLKHLEA